MNQTGRNIQQARIRVLVTEPDAGQRETLCRFLRAWDYQPVVAPASSQAIERAARKEFAVALVTHIGKKAGFEFLRALRQADPGLETILLGKQTSPEFATEAFRAGAYDCLCQPLDYRQLSRDLNALRESLHKRAERAACTPPSDQEALCGGMIGACGAMRAVFAQIRRVARSSAPVLITGATGTGKELASRAVHRLGAGSDEGLVVYRCCGVSEDAADQELFGWAPGPGAAKRGAAQSAAKERNEGILGEARQGALFLDEVGDLPLGVQKRLERFLKSASQSSSSDRRTAGPPRILATSRCNLFEAVRQGRFSKQLYERLSQDIIHLPSLSERMEDLPLLSRHILNQANREYGKQVQGFSPEAEWALLHYGWPGNIRELENVIVRACLLADGERIEVQDLSIVPNGGKRSTDLPAGSARGRKVSARINAEAGPHGANRSPGGKN